MFDIGLSELVLLFIIGLIILGPERMPKVAQSIGNWAGRARGFVRSMNSELQREMRATEVKKQLDEAKRILDAESQELKADMDVDNLAAPVAEPIADSKDKTE